MSRNSFAAALLLSGLIASPVLAQTDTGGGTEPPGKAAPPSLESNRGATTHAHSRSPRRHAHHGPGKAASPSVKANEGDTGTPSTNAPPATGANAGAGGPASLSNNRDQGAPR